jgi:predicted Fe-Mo cluster-binding NifX family protein
MKIILTSVSPDLESEVDPRFGRSAYFLLVDTETLERQAFPNPGVNSPGGAGSQAAQFVVNLKPDAVISGDFGPNAFNVLESAGISMHLFGQCRTVAETIQRYKSGQLEPLAAPARRGRMHR